MLGVIKMFHGLADQIRKSLVFKILGLFIIVWTTVDIIASVMTGKTLMSAFIISCLKAVNTYLFTTISISRWLAILPYIFTILSIVYIIKQRYLSKFFKQKYVYIEINPAIVCDITGMDPERVELVRFFLDKEKPPEDSNGVLICNKCKIPFEYKKLTDIFGDIWVEYRCPHCNSSWDKGAHDKMINAAKTKLVNKYIKTCKRLRR